VTNISVAKPIPPPPPAQPALPEERGQVITIRPWIDPLVDEIGHAPFGRYFETFWLGVLGPTATWLVRRLVAGLERDPDGYEIDLVATARTMGMSYSAHRSSPFAKALQRCTMFGLTHQTSDGLAVRRRIPSVAERHLRRMPESLRLQHEAWLRTPSSVDEFARAHRLAVAMIEAGDDINTIEHLLVSLGVGDAIAAEVADNAAGL
jgi:hypothetical protein